MAQQTNDIYVDEDCVVSFCISEFGWFLGKWASYLRFLKHQVYKDKKFILFSDLDYHALVEDFVSYTIELPKWFYELELERDCYEAPLAGSPPGSLTPPDVYKKLIEYIRGFYNKEKAIEVWPPRGCNLWVNHTPQLFRKLIAPKVESDRQIICVYPRKRERASNRNVPEFVWKEVVDELVKSFTVALIGTPSGSALADYEDDHVINLIKYNEDDKMERTLSLFNSALCSVGSQSGVTYLSLESCCPSYIIGHEKQRHAVEENRFNCPVSFRYVEDYRAIDAQTILQDLAEMLNLLQQAEAENSKKNTEILNTDVSTLNSLIGE